jgi:FkbM family methyltransferase
MLNGTYEPFALSLLNKLLPEGGIFVDVGANVGIYTVLGACCTGRTGTVYAFEPEVENFRLLERNLALNDLGHVRVEQAAVGESDGHAVLQIEANSIGTHSLVRSQTGADSLVDQVEVPVVSLDAFFSKIDLGRVDLLKVDVEGFEPKVLAGAQRILEMTQHLLIEYSRLSLPTDWQGDYFADRLAAFPLLYLIDDLHAQLRRIEKEDFRTLNYANILASRTPIVVADRLDAHIHGNK